MQTFPFVPKSSTVLHAGHFWGIALSEGRFACGRVIESPAPASRTLLLAGLLDWVGTSAPTAESIAGAKCIAQGQMHYRSIVVTGGAIQGFRPLELDGIEPWVFRGGNGWRGSQVYKGLSPIRNQTPDDDHLPLLSGWGLQVIQVLADSHLAGRLNV
jgi:hypothetical protein